jgi:hypothetical protein
MCFGLIVNRKAHVYKPWNERNKEVQPGQRDKGFDNP